MAVLLIEVGAFRVVAKYLQKKKNVWYIRRRIPTDVRHLYPGKPEFYFRSLKTSDATDAARSADKIASEQDALWKVTRYGEEVTTVESRDSAMAILSAFNLKPGQSAEYDRYDLEPDAFLSELAYQSGTDDGSIYSPGLPPQYRIASKLFYGEKLIPTLTEVRDKHFALGKGAKSPRGLRQFDNAFGQFLKLFGDLPLDKYRRADVNQYVTVLVERKCAHATIKRYLAQIGPVFATGNREFELNIPNIFEKVVISNRDTPALKRSSFDDKTVFAIQKRCREVDDERRWLISILSDTGARLAEIAGLRLEDIKLEGPTPHIVIKSTEQRRLKNLASARSVPLLGEALWAAQRVVTMGKGTMAFPSYNKGPETNAASASAALNKWMRDQKLTSGPTEVIHSFRHTMRDRLRNADVPTSVCDSIGGWIAQSVGEGYGAGYSLETLRNWMQRAIPLNYNTD